MTNPLYNENFQGQAGQTARAEQVKDELAAVGGAFDQVHEVQQSAIKGPAGEVLNPIPSAVNRAGLFLRFNNTTGQPEAVAAGFTWKGIWAVDTVYVVGDVVRSDPEGTVYVCVVSHTSASSGTIDLAKFEVMISGSAKNRNLIINSNFDIWQRGTSSGAISGYSFLSDHWVIGAGNGTTVAPSRQAFTLGQTSVPNEPSYFHRTVVTAGVAANAFAIFGQQVEGVRTLSGKVATISFWAKADSAKPIALEFIQQFGQSGGSSQVFAHIDKFDLTTAWQKFTATFNVPSIAGKTIGDSKEFLMMQFFFEAGSDYNARTGSLGHQSGTFDIAQVQLEEGPFASDYVTPDIGEELFKCQRYFQLYEGSPGQRLNIGVGSAWATNQTLHYFPFITTMRADPNSVTFAAANQWRLLYNGTGVSVSAITPAEIRRHGVTVVITPSSALAINSAVYAQSGDTATAFIAADAELQ